GNSAPHLDCRGQLCRFLKADVAGDHAGGRGGVGAKGRRSTEYMVRLAGRGKRKFQQLRPSIKRESEP
ncbi:hypothetical protein, partial [Mesorhizobium sp. P5_C1]